MRLINVNTMEMEEFVDDARVKYGILSHRWGDDEVSFQDMQDSETRCRRKGFEKIKRGCRRAAADGLMYFWCDTCCIDKKSTAELSEAINSMFRWYQKSKACYVFLIDVDISEVPPGQYEGEIMKSNWFQREWTLQELIAPSMVKFYDRNWTLLGSKSSLGDAIHRQTGIPEKVLSQAQFSDAQIYSYSLAQRMSWASGRVTTRPEDIAYCLLGIMDINMPLLYGEGTKAFIRLQEEIIKQSDDETIFAWTPEQRGKPLSKERICLPGLLADSPAAFASCSQVVQKDGEGRFPFGMTNRGLSVTLSVRPLMTDTYTAILNSTAPPISSACKETRTECCAGIYLQRTQGDKFMRVTHQGQGLAHIHLQQPNWNKRGLTITERLQDQGFEPRKLQVQQQSPQRLSQYSTSPMTNAFQVRVKIPHEKPRSTVVSFSTDEAAELSAPVAIAMETSPIKDLRLTLDHDLNLCCVVSTRHRFSITPRHRSMQIALLATKPDRTIDRLPTEAHWSTARRDKEFQMMRGVYALKGDEVGFDCDGSRNFWVVASLHEWDHEARGRSWHLQFVAVGPETDEVTFESRKSAFYLQQAVLDI